MNIHQLSVQFIPVEDRLLLRINTQTREILQAWLTRRLMTRLMPQLLNHEEQIAQQAVIASNPDKVGMHSPEARQMLAAMGREAALSRSDFAKPFETQSYQSILQDALLVSRVNLSIKHTQAAGEARNPVLHVQLSHEAEGSQGKSISMDLTATIFHGLMVLLRKAIQQAEWTDIALEIKNESSAQSRPDDEMPKFFH